MKRIISMFLVITSLLGTCAMMFSCKKKDGGVTENKNLTYNSDVIVDFNDSSVISNCGLTAKTDNVKTASNAGVMNVSSLKKVNLSFSKTDLTLYKEISVWMNNTSSEDMKVTFKLVSDNGSTPSEDFYSTVITVHPGWHQYNIPFSQLIEDNAPIKDVIVVGTPLGLKSVNSLALDVLSGSGDLLIDSIYAKTQKYGSIAAQKMAELGNAVCFYEDSPYYIYDQLRYVLQEGNKDISVKADNNTTYVPLAILAQHKAASDIAFTKDKVSFTYNGKAYEYTPESTFNIVGDALGFNPGKAMSVKAKVIGDYICVPMETAAEIFGYQIFYDKMGLVIFSDKKDIYNSANDYRQIYNLIKIIAFENYTGAEILDNMDKLYPDDTHTRIIANQAQFDYLKKLIETDHVYATWFKKFESQYAKGTSEYNKPLPKFVLPDGYRLLGVSREAMGQITAYSFLYKMTDNPDYAERVKKVMQAVAKLRDPVSGCRSWHPEHFLDTGELMYGFSIGYDWCYDYFTPEERKTFEDAIWECGFGAALGFGEIFAFWNDPKNIEDYNNNLPADKEKYHGYQIGRGGAPYQLPDTDNTRYTPFAFNRPNWRNNWNGVCNGGMVTMCLAFANVNANFREYAEYILDCCLYTIPEGLESGYATDGGYPEGTGYWGYGTTYSTIFISGLTSASGSNLGFINAPGFRESFYFINSLGTYAEGTWNYHDSGLSTPGSDLYFWFASSSGDKSIGGIRYNSIFNGYSSAAYWDLLFYNPSNIETKVNLNLDAVYYGIDTATIRSDWTDNALFCGLHGGKNNASHGNLDIGNFILEYGGTRFFIDLGSDNYNTQNSKYTGNNSVIYFSNPYRYWLYREKAEGQNTLVIDPVRCDTTNRKSGDNAQGKNYDQLLSADSQMTRFESSKNSALAVIDMGCAYRELSSGERGMLVTNNRSTVIIQDELNFNDKNDHEVYWMGHVGYETIDGKRVSARIDISEDKQSAIVTLEGKSLLCRIVIPEGSDLKMEFRSMAANYLPVTGLVNSQGETPRDGLQKLVAYTSNAHDNCKFAIVCSLLNDGPYDYQFTDIKDWKVD